MANRWRNEHNRASWAMRLLALTPQMGWIALAVTFMLGCSSVPETSRTSSPEPADNPVVVEMEENPSGGAASGEGLRKGMTPAEVENLLGPPADREQTVIEGIDVEIWTYWWRKQESVRETATEMIMVPYVDPVNGEMRMMPEAKYGLEVIVLKENLELLFHEDLLVTWKHYFERERSFR